MRKGPVPDGSLTILSAPIGGQDPAERRAEVHRQVGVRRGHPEPDGVVVDRLHLLDRPECRPSGRRGLRVQDALEGEHDVPGLELAAVVELHPLTEGERPRPGLGVPGPAGRQHRLGLELLVDPREVVVGGLGDHVLVTLDRQRRVERPGRAGPRHLERPAWPGCLRLSARPDAGGGAGRERQLQEPATAEVGRRAFTVDLAHGRAPF